MRNLTPCGCRSCHFSDDLPGVFGAEAEFGIPAHDIVLDPPIIPVGAMATAGQQVSTPVLILRDELCVNTICGATKNDTPFPEATQMVCSMAVCERRRRRRPA